MRADCIYARLDVAVTSWPLVWSDPGTMHMWHTSARHATWKSMLCHCLTTQAAQPTGPWPLPRLSPAHARQVEVNGMPVTTLKRGSYFGEVGLLRGTRRSACVRAVSAVCDLFVLSKVILAGQHGPHIFLIRRLGTRCVCVCACLSRLTHYAEGLVMECWSVSTQHQLA